MPERVFLSFNGERDSARAQQVASSRDLDRAGECGGVLTRAEWLTLERAGTGAVQKWVDAEFAASSITVVLIGGETCKARWVHYAIRKSRDEGRGMFGLYVHRLADPRTGRCDYRGQNPFELTYVAGENSPVYLSEIYPIYDWVADDGPQNLEKWVTLARAQAARFTTGTRRRDSGPNYRLAGGSRGMNSPSSMESPRTR